VLVTIIGIQHRQQLLLLLLVPTETHRSTALSLNGKASPLICGMQVACAAYLPCLNGKASPSICGMQSFCSFCSEIVTVALLCAGRVPLVSRSTGG